MVDVILQRLWDLTQDQRAAQSASGNKRLAIHENAIRTLSSLTVGVPEDASRPYIVLANVPSFVDWETLLNLPHVTGTTADLTQHWSLEDWQELPKLKEWVTIYYAFDKMYTERFINPQRAQIKERAQILKRERDEEQAAIYAGWKPKYDTEYRPWLAQQENGEALMRAEADPKNALTQAHRNAIRAYQGYKCFDCGSTELTTGHAFPQSRGGSDWADNIVLQCVSCNSKQGTKIHPRAASLWKRPLIILPPLSFNPTECSRCGAPYTAFMCICSGKFIAKKGVPGKSLPVLLDRDPQYLPEFSSLYLPEGTTGAERDGPLNERIRMYIDEYVARVEADSDRYERYMRENAEALQEYWQRKVKGADRWT